MERTGNSPRRYLFYVEDNYCYSILRPLQDEIRARGDEVAWLLVGTDIDPAGLHPDERVLKDVRDAIAWNAGVVFVPGNQVPSFIPGIKVTSFHGLISGKRRFKDGENYHFIIRGMFDLYCTHGPNTTGRFRELAQQHGHFDVAETGWSKLDPLFNGSVERTGDERPVIYFASTFSPRLSAAPVLLETVRALAETRDWRWVVNFHPKMSPEVVERYRAIDTPNLEFVDTDDILPLLVNADVMLCDTSSIITEFAILQKPVVTFRNLDPQPFMINVTEADGIGPALEKALTRPPELMDKIAALAAQSHPYFDGLSSRRTLEAADRMAAEGLGKYKRKPLNLIRHYKMRRQLNYFRFF
jgi:CDP-glycerol glycerophosphotransferase (TagB/SpsB family)